MAGEKISKTVRFPLPLWSEIVGSGHEHDCPAHVVKIVEEYYSAKRKENMIESRIHEISHLREVKMDLKKAEEEAEMKVAIVREINRRKDYLEEIIQKKMDQQKKGTEKK